MTPTRHGRTLRGRCHALPAIGAVCALGLLGLPIAAGAAPLDDTFACLQEGGRAVIDLAGDHGYGRFHATEPADDAVFDARRQRVVGRAAKGVTGTRIRYWADKQIFTKDAAFTLTELEQRARQTAFLVPGLEIVIRDERGEEAVETSFRFDGGISEFADFLAPDAPITDTWRLTGSGVRVSQKPSRFRRARCAVPSLGRPREPLAMTH